MKLLCIKSTKTIKKGTWYRLRQGQHLGNVYHLEPHTDIKGTHYFLKEDFITQQEARKQNINKILSK